MTNPEENKGAFYSQLMEVLSKVPKKDKLILTGSSMQDLIVNRINGKVLLTNT